MLLYKFEAQFEITLMMTELFSQTLESLLQNHRRQLFHCFHQLRSTLNFMCKISGLFSFQLLALFEAVVAVLFISVDSN